MREDTAVRDSLQSACDETDRNSRLSHRRPRSGGPGARLKVAERGRRYPGAQSRADTVPSMTTTEMEEQAESRGTFRSTCAQVQARGYTL